MKTLLATSAVLSSLFLLGCKDDVGRMVELEEIKAAGYEKAGDDCNKIAAALEDFNKTYGKEHKELMAKLKEKYPSKADAEKATEKYKDRLEKNKKVIIGAVFKCADNEAYSKAIKSGD